jgi:hypothetical protein
MMAENSHAHKKRALINIALGNTQPAYTDLQEAIDLGHLKE